MIGGWDFVILGDTEPGELALILQQLRAEWPSLIVEDAIDGTKVEPGELEPNGDRELLIYEDQGSFDSWSADGLTSENEFTMIQLLFLPDSITLVIDGAGKLTGLAENVRNRLTAYRLSPPKEYYVKLVERAA